MDKLLTNYRALPGFSSDFTQTKKLSALGMQLKGRGQLQVRQDRTIVWKVIEPALLTVTIDSKEISVETTAGGKSQKQVYSLTEGVAGNQIAGSVKPFLDLFTGSSAVLEKQFDITQQGEAVVLVPKERLPIEKLELFPDPDRLFIARIIIHEKSGDSIEYLFSKPTALVQ